jgi:hypothetical protein
MRDAIRRVGHPNGPRRSMSVTKLKTVGSWPPALWQNTSAEPRTRVRGRVITGLLTGGDAASESPPVAEDPRRQRSERKVPLR